LLVIEVGRGLIQGSGIIVHGFAYLLPGGIIMQVQPKGKSESL